MMFMDCCCCRPAVVVNHVVLCVLAREMLLPLYFRRCMPDDVTYPCRRDGSHGQAIQKKLRKEDGRKLMRRQHEGS